MGGADLDEFIDELQDEVRNGTLLFPCFNWDYCKGKPFSIGETKGKTGVLGEAARHRSDFERTQHPVYSFAVWGKLKRYLCDLENVTSFGWGSPFAVIDKMLGINVTAQHSLTFVHHVEQVMGAPWRFEKSFGDYSMYVRKPGVDNYLHCFDIVDNLTVHSDGDTYKLWDMAKVFHRAKVDILTNSGKGVYRGGAAELEHYFDKLWPHMRSLTGWGNKVTLGILEDIVPLVRHDVPSGTKVFDWEVPQEWHFTEAYLRGPDGRKFIDAKDCNLHLVNYSVPFRGKMDLADLHTHLHLPPREAGDDAIPYVTSYYKPDWGFCLSWNQRMQMRPGIWDVVVDTELAPGSLTYADLVLPGELDKEVWFSTYICHPSMANNELSGPLAVAFLARKVQAMEKRRYTYRFIFVPETIGSLCYLAYNCTHGPVMAGYEVTCCGDRAPLQYKRTRSGCTVADEVAEYVIDGRVRDYFPHRGADERHYNLAGLDFGTVMRSAPGEYPEYHTSLDNKSFMDFDNLQQTIDTLYEMVQVLEMNGSCYSIDPHGEPMLGERGLYNDPELVDAIRWVLAYPNINMVPLANRSGLPVELLHKATNALISEGLVFWTAEQRGS